MMRNNSEDVYEYISSETNIYFNNIFYFIKYINSIKTFSVSLVKFVHTIFALFFGHCNDNVDCETHLTPCDMFTLWVGRKVSREPGKIFQTPKRDFKEDMHKYLLLLCLEFSEHSN